MICPIVAVRDRLTGFKNIVVEPNLEVAKRQFKNSFNQTLLIDRSDFELHHVGDFDTETGKLIPLESTVLIMTGNEVNINVSDNVQA